MTKANQGFLFELFRSGDKTAQPETKESRSVPPRIAFIDLNLIRPNPAEPRKTSNETGLRELADSIQEYGLLNPILVRPEQDGTFTTLAGSRRFKACQQLGHKGRQGLPAIDLESEGTIEETMSFMFEKLEVYQRAVDLAEKIDGLTETFATRGHYHLVDQLRRASLSISLNIAEGNGRWHVKDRKNFFWIARGSAFECVPVLELCKRQKLITQETYAALKAELEILSKMLSALIKGTGNRE